MDLSTGWWVLVTLGVGYGLGRLISGAAAAATSRWERLLIYLLGLLVVTLGAWLILTL